MDSQSINGRHPKGHYANGEPSRKRLKRDDDPSDEESSSSDETSSSEETSSSDEDTSDEDSSSEDASEDDAQGGEEDLSVVGVVLNQTLNAPNNSPADPADPAAPAPQIQLDETELEAITDRVLDVFDPNDMGASITAMVSVMEEAAGGHTPTLGAILGHVMGALNQERHPEEFGVRNPAPPYSQLPGREEVTMELAARLPEYIGYTPRYTREPMPPPPEGWQGMRGQKRKREVDDDGEEEHDENEEGKSDDEKNEEET